MWPALTLTDCFICLNVLLNYSHSIKLFILFFSQVTICDFGALYNNSKSAGVRSHRYSSNEFITIYFSFTNFYMCAFTNFYPAVSLSEAEIHLSSFNLSMATCGSLALKSPTSELPKTLNCKCPGWPSFYTAMNSFNVTNYRNHSCIIES